MTEQATASGSMMGDETAMQLHNEFMAAQQAWREEWLLARINAYRSECSILKRDMKRATESHKKDLEELEEMRENVEDYKIEVRLCREDASALRSMYKRKEEIAKAAEGRVREMLERNRELKEDVEQWKTKYWALNEDNDQLEKEKRSLMKSLREVVSQL